MTLSTHKQQNVLRTYLVTGVFVVVMVKLIEIFIGPLIACAPVLPSRTKYAFQSFDSNVWRSNRSLRVNMLYDLLFWHKLENQNRQQVETLLGTPDGPATQLQPTGIPPTTIDSYVLSGYDYLKIVYDINGKVTYILAVPGSNS